MCFVICFLFSYMCYRYLYFLHRTEDRSKDSIAEPLYSLISEVYELHGMFKWLRKSFISFVEVTFGRSINRYVNGTFYAPRKISGEHIVGALSVCAHSQESNFVARGTIGNCSFSLMSFIP
jgi:hypothetical protein